MICQLSIVIPAYNEESRIGKTLETIEKFMEENNISHEIIVVDDGSKDNTENVVSQFPRVSFLKMPINVGKGAAVRQGMIKAIGEIVLFSDADLSTPIHEVIKLLTSIKSGYDIAIGSRAVDYSSIKVRQPFYREFMGRTFNKLVQLFAIKGIKDTQCGFKAFKKESAHKIFNIAKINGFGFDVEILYLAQKLNYKIDEVSVEWYNDERSTVNPIKDSIRMFRDIFSVKRIHGKTKF
jgi:dolichyl-phosphate beta-glucosyltransferase